MVYGLKVESRAQAKFVFYQALIGIILHSYCLIAFPGPPADSGMKRIQICLLPTTSSNFTFRCKSRKCPTSISKLKKFQNFVDVIAIWLFSMVTTFAFFRRFIRTPTSFTRKGLDKWLELTFSI